MRPASVFAVCLVGCASVPTADLTPDVLARMQREARIELYDRENDVVIARNRADEVRLRIASLQHDLDELGTKGKRMQKRVAERDQKNDTDSEGGLTKTVRARRGYLETQLRLQRASLALAAGQVATSAAHLEQTRQRQLVRTGRALAATMARFDAQVKRLELAQKDLEKRELDLAQKSETAFQDWKTAEDEYAKSTGDWDTGIWVD